MEAEDGGTVKADQATETAADGPEPEPDAAKDLESDTSTDTESTAETPPEPDASAESDIDIDTTPDSDPDADPGSGIDSIADIDAAPDSDPDVDPDSAADPESTGSRRPLPVAPGIGCAALLLPIVAVVGAILCFAAGILSAATGCAPNGSALCSANGPWFSFALPLFVSPLIAAGAAIGAVTVRRHRSTWLAVGYAIVFISLIVGLASASTGSN